MHLCPRSMHTHTPWHYPGLERACAPSPDQPPGAYPSTAHGTALCGALRPRQSLASAPPFTHPPKKKSNPTLFSACRCWRRPRPAARATRPARPRQTPATRTRRTPCADPDGARAPEAQGYLVVAGGYLARLTARTVKMLKAAWAKKRAASACCAYRTPTRPAPSKSTEPDVWRAGSSLAWHASVCKQQGRAGTAARLPMQSISVRAASASPARR